MNIEIASFIGTLAFLGGIAAWFHKDRLDGKDDIIRKKDAEIDLLQRSIQSPSDLMIQVQLIRTFSEAEIKDVRRQLSQVAESEQARRLELVEKLKDIEAHRTKIGDLEKKLAEQTEARTKLELEVVSLRGQPAPTSGSFLDVGNDLSVISIEAQAECDKRSAMTPKERREIQ